MGVLFCDRCAITGKNMVGGPSNRPQKVEDYGKGFLLGYDNIVNCPYCQNPVKDIGVTSEDFFTIRAASNYNRQLLEAMVALREKDIIEYELKMSQFRTQVAQMQTTQQQNVLTCPKCGSTNVTTGARGWKWTTGFIGSSKTVNRCGNCGHTWKPGR